MGTLKPEVGVEWTGCGGWGGAEPANRKWGRERPDVGHGEGGDFEPEVRVGMGVGNKEGGDCEPEVGEGKAGCGEGEGAAFKPEVGG